MSWSPFFAALLGTIPIVALVLVIAEVTPAWWMTQGSLTIILLTAGLIDGRRRYRAIQSTRESIKQWIDHA